MSTSENLEIPFFVVKAKDISFTEKDIIKIAKLRDMILLGYRHAFTEGFVLNKTLYLIGSEVVYACELKKGEYEKVLGGD